mmetsp:Transcript_17493/g.28315  ORF Transcript_17493/g.28315 Transcript_17493/m.28315 type:complete len:202 (+) Transcript_17493:1030-1635(+)|eukprot:CAMPEP_0196223496 /NCGR_PEP_ID=MMETSP0912-20130531/46801_1 /TAXON_ID=49265 /ORGANISM="Thalassiosira rotula, Strain GSO102" /LENGTH=201 /DNA_ID=CAMNT_0041502577 /DNA_START=38 /DNA_END=643 /DNA_ORIENTATION=-
MASNTVRFNVGGRHFEVSRALISQHSDTMLGKTVSEAWNEDPEEAVFIDRDGEIFAHLLNYIRYGSVELPLNVPKSMFDRELDFYGISSVESAVCQQSLAQVTNAFRKEFANAKSKNDMFLLALESQYQYGMKEPNSNGFVPVQISKGHEVYNERSLSSDENELFASYLQTYFGLRVATNSEVSYYLKPTTSGTFWVTEIS